MGANLLQITQNLVGNYKKISNYAYQNITTGIILHVGRNRKSKRTDKLLVYYEPETKKTQFISGLFPLDEPNKLYFDTFDKYYIITFNDEGAIIEKTFYAYIIASRPKNVTSY